MHQNQPMKILNLRIIWTALLGSQLIYGFVLIFLISQNDTPPESVNQFLLPMFSSVAIILFFAAIYLQRFLLKEAKKQLQAKTGELVLSKLNIEDLIQFYTAPFIVRLALFEAVALFGFSLGFLNKDINFYIPFVTASMVAYFFNFPTEEKTRNAFK
jgi:hypothetical protein